MTSLCTAGITAHAREEKNPHPPWQKYPYQLQPEDILYRQQHWSTLGEKKQMSRIILLLLTIKCARLWWNHSSVPGYVRFLPVISASSISFLYLCQHSGRDTASRVNDEQWDRWFLLSSGVMASSLVSVTEPKLTDRPTHKQHGRPLHSCRLMMTFAKWRILFGYVPICFPGVVLVK